MLQTAQQMNPKFSLLDRNAHLALGKSRFHPSSKPKRMEETQLQLHRHRIRTRRILERKIGQRAKELLQIRSTNSHSRVDPEIAEVKVRML